MKKYNLHYQENNPSKCWSCKYACDVQDVILLNGWCGCFRFDGRESFTDFPNCEDYNFGWIYKRRPYIRFPQNKPTISVNFMLRTKKVTFCPYYQNISEE